MSPASHLVPNPPAHENGHGQPVTQTRFEELLHELTDKFGSATSFVRAPGQGLWDSGGDVERDKYRGDRGHDSSPGIVSDRVALG